MLRVHVALGGPISVGVVKSRLFFLVRGVIKEGTGGQHGEPFQTAVAFRQEDKQKKEHSD